MNNSGFNTGSNKSATVVMKTVERCNINCSYCYFFNGIDNSYAKHSPYISETTIDQIGNFLLEGCNSLNINKVYISLHGGEPLMQKKEAFDRMCTSISSKLTGVAKTIFSVQTNGTLIDNEWLNILAKHQVHIGISLDGPKEYHDTYRQTKNKKGTYDAIVNNINEVRSHPYYKNVGLGVLTVINPKYNAKTIFRHFVNDLALDSIDFLIPDYTHSYPSPYKDGELSKYIIDIFELWQTADNPNIKIRLFKNIIDLILGKNCSIYGFGPSSLKIPLITISSDGDLSPVDELRSADPRMMNTGKTIYNCNFKDFIHLPFFNMINKALNSIPDKCASCCWKNVCRGGPILNRFSRENLFNNASIYCNDLKRIYAFITGYLLKNGISFSQIEKQLLN